MKNTLSKRNVTYLGLIIVSFLFSFASIASASVVLLQDNRYVDDYGYVGDYGTIFTPSTPFADWSYRFDATQTSSVGIDSMSGSGSGGSVVYLNKGTGEVIDFVTRSVFDVSFRVENTQILSLQGALEANLGDFSAGTVAAAFYLDGPVGFSNVSRVACGGDFCESPLSLSEVLTLMPGDYQLLFSTYDIAANTNSNWSFQASFASVPVPVPSAIWLFVSGFGLLFALGKGRIRH